MLAIGFCYLRRRTGLESSGTTLDVISHTSIHCCMFYLSLSPSKADL